MCFQVTYRLTRALLTATAVALSLTACGGGTTGTSPTGELKLAGFAEQSDGDRAPGLSMTVRSGTTDRNLKDSGTDERGEFAMELPASENVLIVDVAGLGAATIARQQRGAGTITTKLVKTVSGDLNTAGLFEVQIDESSLCTALLLNGNQLVVTGEVSGPDCPVTLTVAAQSAPVSSFNASVVAVCNGLERVLQSQAADRTGTVTVDLKDAIVRDCTGIRISVSNSQTAELASIFPVE